MNTQSNSIKYVVIFLVLSVLMAAFGTGTVQVECRIGAQEGFLSFGFHRSCGCRRIIQLISRSAQKGQIGKKGLVKVKIVLLIEHL